MNDHTAITIMGLGGCGCNAILDLQSGDLPNVRWVAVNTELPSLGKMDTISTAIHTIQIGAAIAEGRGLKGDVSKGREAALESREALLAAIESGEPTMLVVIAGLGGGTGTGAAPVVLQLARERGLKTAAFVTTPFRFEGPKAAAVAESALKELEPLAHVLRVFSNEERTRTVSDGASMDDISSLAGMNGAVRELMEGWQEYGSVTFEL